MFLRSHQRAWGSTVEKSDLKRTERVILLPVPLGQLRAFYYRFRKATEKSFGLTVQTGREPSSPYKT